MLTISPSSSTSRTGAPATRHALITVSIADGNSAFRDSLSQALARFPGVVIFDKCPNARTAAQALSDRPPRVLFASNALPDTPQWQLIETVRNLRLATQVIAVSDSDAVPDVQAAFRAGAMGYLLRSTPVSLIHQALYEVTGGGAPLAPSVARALVSSFSAPAAPTGLLADLSSREAEVLDLLSRGLRYRQIASSMKLSPDTVHSHAKNVYRKLNVRSKTEAAMIWLRNLSDGAGASRGLPEVAPAVA